MFETRIHSKLPSKDIIRFYCTCIRPVLEYGCEAFHFALPDYLSADLERVQWRVTSIIFSDFNYNERLLKCGLASLKDRCQTACGKLFHQVINDPQHKLSPLLPERSSTEYNLRNRCSFQLPKIKTN